MSAKRAKKDRPEQPAPKATSQVKITAAKGRPMLTWVGKRPLAQVTAFPAQLVERHDALDILGLRQAETEDFEKGMDAYQRRVQVLRDLGDSWNRACWEGQPSLEMATQEQGGLLFHGDNKDVLAFLLANGYRRAVNLIYIDPPFDSGADYVRKVALRGTQAKGQLPGEAYSLGEQVQYSDIWAKDVYLQWMFERLLLLKELLSDDGTIFLHCDNSRMHHLRCLLDEVFGAENFINEIVWQHQIMGGSHDKRFPKAHETLFWYAKGNGYRLRSESKEVRVPFSEYVLNSMEKDDDGRWYYERRRMSRKATAEEAAAKAHTRTYVTDPGAGTVATDVWNDMLSYQEPPNEREGIDLYPTQKTTRLLTRIISAASDRGDLVMDAFAGSGVVMKVAQRLGRRWIGCDINKGAIQTVAKRLRTITDDQIHETLTAAEKKRQNHLPGVQDDADAPPRPAQFGFTVWRVNDYDLQIQHNEVVNLACEHIGVVRTRGDSFFDGTRGKSLVKIIPFSHPLAPLDLEELKRELEARPDEDRDLTLVCLGIEVAARAWIDDWNRLRKGAKGVNRIDVIELRTDSKYGKFIKHEPATARVKIFRKNGRIRVEIADFISPTIIERLEQPGGLLKVKIDDWRAMVDCVMIDTAYDGQVFNVVLADVPEKKNDLVEGNYEIPYPAEKTSVAVKIIDMLGEEVLVVQAVDG